MPHEPPAGKLGAGTIFRLAWRNLVRNRRRTLITAITVAVAVLLMQFMASLLIGLERQSFDNLINYQTAHAKVFPEGYFEKREDFPLEYSLSHLDSLQEAIRQVEGVAATTPRLVFSAQISNGVDQITCLGTGIQVTGSDSDVFRLPQAIVDGTYLQAGQEGLLVGSGLANLFGVSSGDWLTVLVKTRTGAYEALDLEVTGLVGTGNPLIDQSSVMLPLATAQTMLDMPGAATEVAVRFVSTAPEERTLERLRSSTATGARLELKGWRDIEEDFMSLVRMKRSGQVVLLGILVILAVVGITNTVLMSTYERTREIGTLMAMGLRGRGIRQMFLAEGALTGLLGGAMGTAIAMIIVGIMASVGWDISATYGDMDIGYPVKDMVYPAFSTLVFFVSWLFTGVLAAVAALYPAARASRQKPVEALRHV